MIKHLEACIINNDIVIKIIDIMFYDYYVKVRNRKQAKPSYNEFIAEIIFVLGPEVFTDEVLQEAYEFVSNHYESLERYRIK